MKKSKLNYCTARDILLSEISPVGTEKIGIKNCAGRVLAKDLLAAEDVPSFARSPYDGYAFRADDSTDASAQSPVTLRVIEDVPAGAVPTMGVVPGTAIRVMTGSPIPPGADAVRQYEKTEFDARFVRLLQPAKTGENIVRVGEDVRKGTVLAEAGMRIDAGIAGSLAAQGVTQPEVYRALRVGILSTGGELVDAATCPGEGCIRDTNAYTLMAALHKEGFATVHYGIIGDNTLEIRDCMEQALKECDALVMTGGVATGEQDLTAAAMGELGARILFFGVDLKPGMSCAYGIRGGKPICGLSGNPASAITNFYAIGLPALRRLSGLKACIQPEFTVTLKDPFPKKCGATRLLRGTLDLTDGTPGIRLRKEQGNVVISSMIGCDAFAIVPPGVGPLEIGAKLQAFMM